MDIKHMDSKKHKMFTSQPNERILEMPERSRMQARSLSFVCR